MQSDNPSATAGATSLLPSPLAHTEIETIWINAAAEIGWRVERQLAAYATSDGQGRILIGADEILDGDDAVAQLVFHELCHGLVAGPAHWTQPDWGLSNTDDRDIVQEHACLRVQVHLADRHALRELMAPTTEYRAYHDELPGDPLHDDSDPAAALAKSALARVEAAGWIVVLDRALAATRVFLDEMATRVDDAAIVGALHPVGFPFASPEVDETCGTCAWRYRGGRGRPVERCRQSAAGEGNGRRTDPRFRACVRWEPLMDCLTCGACCREAYHSVTVSVRDPVVWKQPDLIVRNGHRFEIRRAGDRCAALHSEDIAAPSGAARSIRNALASPGAASGRVFSCEIYVDRPRPCRDFEANGRHCLVARRRVGLSP